MGISTKIILGLLIGIIGVFLLFITFFQKPTGVIQDIYDGISLTKGIFQIEKQEGVFREKPVENTTGTGFFIDKISNLDSVFSQDTHSYTLDTTGEIQSLAFQNGSYAVDIRDFTEQYTISGEGFQIHTLGQGMFFLKIEGDQVTIFSQSSTLRIDLRNTLGDSMTETYLYPHMFLSFNSKRNQFIENGDIVRVSSVASLGYSAASINKKESINPLLSDFFSGFFSEVFFYQQQRNTQIRSSIETIRNTFVFDFPGSSTIEKYYQFFINDEKKKSYYKNKFLKSLITLVKNPTGDMSTSELSENLKALSLYPKEAQEANDILQLFLYVFSYSYENTDIAMRRVLSNNLQGNTEKKVSFFSSLFLSSLYNQYDFQGQYSYEDLQKFFDDHLKDLGINIQKQESFSAERRTHLDYFVFFLEKVFVGGLSMDELSSQKTIQYTDIITIFSDYSELSTILYSLGDTKKKITALYIYVEILGNFERYIHDTFFEKERGKNDVLIRKKNVSIAGESFISLKNQVNVILDFYNKNKILLDLNTKRDVLIDKSLLSLKQNFNEYFLALENYDSYVYNYDETKKNLLSLQTGESTDLVFNSEVVSTYLSQFQGANIDTLQVEFFEKPIEAQIKNYYINGKKLSFSLYPLSEYLIDNITIDDKRIPSSYKLNLIQADWEQKKANSTQENEKTKYDFSYFFFNTFFSSQSETTPEIFEIEQTVEEDKVIVVFKRDKLLGKNGEFSSLQKFLPLDYNSLKVTPNGETYDIFIQDAPARITVNNSGGSISYVFNISGEYILTDGIRSFQNLEVKKYIDYEKNKNLFAIAGAGVKIAGQINIKDLEATLQSYAIKYSEVSAFLDGITQKVSFITNLNGYYSLENSRFIFEGKVGTKDVKMTLEGNKLISLIVNNQEKLASSIETTNITKISLLIFSK